MVQLLTHFRCCLPYKGTNFSANHNISYKFMQREADVVYPTKVRIFQQITTGTSGILPTNRMLFTLQRYEFFSKSQRTFVGSIPEVRCCLPYKGTNFSANHNYDWRTTKTYSDVVYPTKVRIFQQITTLSCVHGSTLLMLFTLQRYEFFSKSQLTKIILYFLRDVVYPTKVRIFQQITTRLG